MKAKLFVAAALALCLVSIVVPVRNSYANDLTAFLSQGDDATSGYNSSIHITLTYPSGSPISQMMAGKNEKESFGFNGTAGDNPNSDSAISAFNRALIVANSTVHVVAIQGSYEFKLQGVSDTQAILSYTLRTSPEIQKYIITSQGDSKVMDLNWRRITVDQPIIYNAPGLGKVDLNHPSGILQAKYPDLMKKFVGTSAEYIFNLPLLQFNTFNHPMDTWHHLFDPSGSLVETQGAFKGNSTTKAVTVYSLGESSFREGTFNPETHDETVNIDGGSVKVHSEQPPPSGQIQIAGFVTLNKNGNDDMAIVTSSGNTSGDTATGGFPFQVLLVFGGMMGAIAVFVLIKGRK